MPAAGGVLGAHADDVGLGIVNAEGDAAFGVAQRGELPALRVVVGVGNMVGGCAGTASQDAVSVPSARVVDTDVGVPGAWA